MSLAQQICSVKEKERFILLQSIKDHFRLHKIIYTIINGDIIPGLKYIASLFCKS